MNNPFELLENRLSNIENLLLDRIRPSNDIFSGMILATTFAKKNHAAQKIFKQEHA